MCVGDICFMDNIPQYYLVCEGSVTDIAVLLTVLSEQFSFRWLVWPMIGVGWTGWFFQRSSLQCKNNQSSLHFLLSVTFKSRVSNHRLGHMVCCWLRAKLSCEIECFIRGSRWMCWTDRASAQLSSRITVWLSWHIICQIFSQIRRIILKMHMHVLICIAQNKYCLM